jgi:hypothetical protein
VIVHRVVHPDLTSTVPVGVPGTPPIRGVTVAVKTANPSAPNVTPLGDADRDVFDGHVL